MSNIPTVSQSNQGHFHQYHPTRTFENSNRQQFHHQQHQSSPFQINSSPVAQNLTPSSSTTHVQPSQLSEDLPPRFRRLAKSDQENRYSQQRPMSGDFDRFPQSSRFNSDNRFQSRPQSFYDFSSSNSNNNFSRSSNNNNNNNANPPNRYQRNNHNQNSLPLSAYMNTDRYENENFNTNNNSWSTTYQRRRPNQQRTYQDRHQFPLSSYDPRQYGFQNNYQRRNDHRNNTNRRNINPIDPTNDIDLIEEWWEDDNTELIGTNPTPTNTDSKIAIDDSGNSSLSTSIHLKESTLDDDEHNTSANDVITPPSDLSVADSNEHLHFLF